MFFCYFVFMIYMDYFGIIKRAWQITWQHKFLWLFGFFAAGLSSASFNFSFPSSQNNKGLSDLNASQISQQLSEFFLKYWFVFLFLGLFFLLIFLVFFVLNIVSNNALIGCVKKIQKDETTNLKDGFGLGFSKFWKMLGLRVLFGVIVFLTLIILAVPVISLFIFQMYGRGLILLILALAIFLPLVFIFSFVLNYAMRGLVLENLGIFSSINFGFYLFKNNILQTAVIFLILMAASFAIGVLFLMLLFFIALPFIIFGIIFYFAGGWIGSLIVGIIGFLTLFVLIVLISSVYNTFASCTWTLTYLELEKRARSSVAVAAGS